MKLRMGERDGTGAERTAITSLTVAAKAFPWHTPDTAGTASNTGSNCTLTPPGLGNQSKHWPPGSAWPSPAARDEKGPNGAEHFATKDRPHEDQLPNAVTNWATPNVPSRGPELKSKKRAKSGGEDLLTQATYFPSSHPDGETPTTPIIPTGGLGLLLQRWTPPSCRVLNPNFQWWLMGWPSPARTFSASGATAFRQWRQQSRSWLNFLLSSTPMERSEVA